MKLNKTLLFVPLLGILHLIVNGLKNGWFTEIENTTPIEIMCSAVVQAVSILGLCALIAMFVC